MLDLYLRGVSRKGEPPLGRFGNSREPTGKVVIQVAAKRTSAACPMLWKSLCESRSEGSQCTAVWKQRGTNV